MKLSLSALAALAILGTSCTKNIEGIYISKNKTSFFEVYKDKDADKLFFAELASEPNAEGSYRGKGELQLEKQKEGKGYDLTLGGQPSGLSIYPSDGGKLKMKSGKDEILTPYKTKGEVKTLADKAKDQLKTVIGNLQPNSPVNNHMSGPSDKVVDKAGMYIAQKAYDANLKNTPFSIKFAKPAKVEDFILHTRLSVVSTLTYKAHSETSTAWEGCKDSTFQYVSQFKTCLKCAPGENFSKKSETDYRCVKSSYFMMGSTDKGKAESQAAVKSSYKISTEAAEILMTANVLIDKESGEIKGRPTDVRYTFNGEDVTKAWNSTELNKKIFKTKEEIFDGQSLSH